MKTSRFVSRLWLLLLLIFLLQGCGTHYQKTEMVQKAIVAGDFAQADTLLSQLKSKIGENNILLFYFDKGMVNHLRGHYAESNQFFEKALERIDELYAKSLSKEALTYITNDLAQPYRGEDFEIVLIHYYMALNYLIMDDLESALVECRRVNVKLTELNDKYEKKNRYKSDAFVHYLMGMIYEANHNLNDAFIAYRNAYETYVSDYESFYALSPPMQLKQDLLRTSEALGFRQEYEQYTQQFPNVTYTSQQYYEEGGEIILIWDNGLVPYKDEGSISLNLEDDDVDDYVRVAFPVYQIRSPQLYQAEVAVGGKSSKSEVYEDVAEIAVKNLEDRRLRITAKSIARAGIKYGIQKQAEEHLGTLGGIFANVVNAATERADTRGWLTLPDNVQVARLLCPPGTYTISVEFMGVGGGVIKQIDFEGVTLDAGEKKFIRHRTFQ